MELIEYKDYEKIKHAKNKMEIILKEIRDETKAIGLSFQNYIVGSGKHKMIFTPKNEENRSEIQFDIDMQIVFQKFDGKSIKKTSSLKQKIDYNEMIQKFLKILNKKMNKHKFQNSGDHHRIQSFHNPKKGFRYEILFIVEREINNNMQWNEIVFNKDKTGYILNEKKSYYDSLKNFKNSKKAELKAKYKDLRELEFDKKNKRPNFELLNLAIRNLKK